MKFQPPKGTKDYLPEEMIRREYIIQIIKKIFEIYGFDPLETPVFEDWELLTKKCGEDIKQQIYYFKDKADRELGLRFDLTVPLARVVASNPQLQKPFKRYAIAPAWRYEEVTKVRKREFYQADIDIVGSESIESDAECIACVIDCLKALGFKDFVVRINNRKILDGFIEIIKADRKKELDIFRAIDKLEKLGENTVKKELKDSGLDDKQIKQLLKLIKTKDVNDARKLLKGISIGEDGLAEIEKIFNITRIYGISDMIKLDLTLARGLDYYTGPIFEVKVRGFEKYGSVAGGGRYDNLIELLGGRYTPATGISLGIERIIEIMETERMFDLPKTKVKVFVASATEDMKPDVISITQELRKEGISCQNDLMGRNLTKQLEYVDSLDIPYCIIVGKKELDKKMFKLRDMKAKSEKEMKLEDIIKSIKR